jgi:hypothetical protein
MSELLAAMRPTLVACLPCFGLHACIDHQSKRQSPAVRSPSEKCYVGCLNRTSCWRCWWRRSPSNWHPTQLKSHPYSERPTPTYKLSGLGSRWALPDITIFPSAIPARSWTIVCSAACVGNCMVQNLNLVRHITDRAPGRLKVFSDVCDKCALLAPLVWHACAQFSKWGTLETL